MNFIFDYDVKVYTVSKTVDSVEGALWLATQTPNILCNFISKQLARDLSPKILQSLEE